MDNILIELESTLTKKIINIDIHKYSHVNFEELFNIIEELVNKLFTTCSYTITNTSINNEYVHIILKIIHHQHMVENTLSVLLSLQYFIIIDIEVSILH